MFSELLEDCAGKERFQRQNSNSTSSNSSLFQWRIYIYKTVYSTKTNDYTPILNSIYIMFDCMHVNRTLAEI